MISDQAQLVFEIMVKVLEAFVLGGIIYTMVILKRSKKKKMKKEKGS